MKRNALWWLLSSLVIVALLLPACAPAAEAPPEEEVEEAVEEEMAEEPVEVIWYVRTEDAEQPWEQDVIIPDFESKHPNIKINLTVVTWDDFDTKMQTMIAAGTPPDVWSHWGPSGFADYVIRGLAADLTPYIEKDNFDLSDFIPEVLDIYTLEGKVYGLPMLTTGSFIYYNKDLFDAQGVEYPPTDWDDTSWTYDAFVDMCGRLNNDTGDPETMSFGCNLGFWPNDAFAWLFGQDLYPDSAYETGFAEESYLDGEGALKGYQARQDLVWDLNYMPDPAQTDAMGGGDIFMNEKVAMHLTGGWGWWNYNDVDFNWGAAALPYGSPDRKCVVFTDPWIMSAQTDHPDEAWEFLKYLVSPETQRSYMELTGTPPARISLAEDWYKLFPTMSPEEVKELHLGALKHGRESPNHLLVRFDQLNQVVNAAVDPIVNNEAKAADVLPDANAQLEEALQSIKAEYE
jgi:multiple sugar transport system substrate-binding protein